MDPSTPPDPPGDGHPLPPANDPWTPATGDLARLTRPATGTGDLNAGTAVTVTAPPDPDTGNVTVAAVIHVTTTVPANHLHPQEPDTDA